MFSFQTFRSKDAQILVINSLKSLWVLQISVANLSVNKPEYFGNLQALQMTVVSSTAGMSNSVSTKDTYKRYVFRGHHMGVKIFISYAKA